MVKFISIILILSSLLCGESVKRVYQLQKEVTALKKVNEKIVEENGILLTENRELKKKYKKLDTLVESLTSRIDSLYAKELQLSGKIAQYSATYNSPQQASRSKIQLLAVITEKRITNTNVVVTIQFQNNTAKTVDSFRGEIQIYSGEALIYNTETLTITKPIPVGGFISWSGGFGIDSSDGNHLLFKSSVMSDLRLVLDVKSYIQDGVEVYVQ